MFQRRLKKPFGIELIKKNEIKLKKRMKHA